MWFKDARKRHRQLKEKAELTQQVDAAGFKSSERALVLFRLFTTLHNISAVKPALSPLPPPSRQRFSSTLKRKHHDSTSKLRPHISPLTPHGNFFSVDDPP